MSFPSPGCCLLVNSRSDQRPAIISSVNVCEQVLSKCEFSPWPMRAEKMNLRIPCRLLTDIITEELLSMETNQTCMNEVSAVKAQWMPHHTDRTNDWTKGKLGEFGRTVSTCGW